MAYFGYNYFCEYQMNIFLNPKNRYNYIALKNMDVVAWAKSLTELVEILNFCEIKNARIYKIKKVFGHF